MNRGARAAAYLRRRSIASVIPQDIADTARLRAATATRPVCSMADADAHRNHVVRRMQKELRYFSVGTLDAETPIPIARNWAG